MQTFMSLRYNAARQAANNTYHAFDHEESEEAKELKWIGLCIVIGSAIMSNLGVNVQKLSHDSEEKRPLFERRLYYTRPLWITGMALVILGSIGDFEALGFAPQALVAAVGGGCTVLANVFFAHLWLKQRLTWNDIIGTLFIIVGVVLSTIANQPDAQLTLEELETQFFHLEFSIYFAAMVCITLQICNLCHSIFVI